MTSAQNHLQRSNGNKLWGVLFLVLMAGMACSASRTGTVLDNRQPTGDTEQTEEEIPDKLKQEEEIKEQKEAAMPEFDRDFHVVLFLPFSLHKEILPGSKDYKVLEGVSDYYQGILLALQQLKQEGIQVTLHVHDTRKDSAYTVKLARSLDLSETDLVIGPLDRKIFEAVATICAEQEIPVVSPFTLPNSSVTANAFAFYCGPPLEAYGMKVARYLLAQRPKGSILHLSDGSATEKAFMRGFQSVSGAEKLTLIRKKIEGNTDYSFLLNKKDSVLNYVLIPSDNEYQSNMALRSFKKAEEDEVPVRVFGMDSWLNFRDPEMDHWEKLNTTLVTAFFSDDSDSSYQRFYHAFRAEHTIPPGEYALRGYDQMLFFGNAMMAFGKYFPGYITGTAFRGIGVDYYWTRGSKVVENRALRFIEFDEYRFHIVP